MLKIVTNRQKMDVSKIPVGLSETGSLPNFHIHVVRPNQWNPFEKDTYSFCTNRERVYPNVNA